MSLLRGPTGPPSTGSRIVEVHDGSSQFAGDAGSSGACWAAVGTAAGRDIPARRRYLPPPGSGEENALDARMRTETVLTFAVVE